MKPVALDVGVKLEAITRFELPPNCEVLSRMYVGDVEYGLARAPKNRGLFLIGPTSAWRLDVPQLLAGFADGLRQWDRDRELELGIEWPTRLRLAKPAKVRKRA